MRSAFAPLNVENSKRQRTSIFPITNSYCSIVRPSLYDRKMNEDQTVSALGALAHAQRLRVFRALVVAGLGGLTPSVLADQLGVARNTLSFHLKELSHAGLVTVEQQGRNLIYRADFSQMNALLGYLTEHCCQGAPCEASDSKLSTRCC